MKNINYKEVYEQTVKNGGHTVEANGRYMVALEQYEVIVSLEVFNEAVLEAYVTIAMPKHGDVTLGTWINENKVYLDTSIAVEDLDEAIALAKKHNQLAIFDTETLETIDTK